MAADGPIVRAAGAADAEALAAIYNHYIRETVVTFEEEPVAAAEMARRSGEVLASGWPWLVAEGSGGVLGYAYATQWRARHGYRFSAEATVYVAPGQTGRRIGTALYSGLLGTLSERGIHGVVGGIALPNDASVALHERCGFKKVAHFEQAGVKFGRWVDVGYWQRILEG